MSKSLSELLEPFKKIHTQVQVEGVNSLFNCGSLLQPVISHGNFISRASYSILTLFDNDRVRDRIYVVYKNTVDDNR